MTIQSTTRTAAAFTAALVLGTALFLLPGGATAQTAAPAPAAAPAAKTTEMSTKPASAKTVKPVAGRSVERQIKLLHASLKITAAQETQWEAVAQVMRDNAKSMRELAQERQQKQDSLDAIADLHSYETIAQAHVDGVKKLIPVFQTLYDTMSADQKKNADSVFQATPKSRSKKPT